MPNIRIRRIVVGVLSSIGGAIAGLLLITENTNQFIITENGLNIIAE